MKTEFYSAKFEDITVEELINRLLLLPSSAEIKFADLFFMYSIDIDDED